VKELTPRALLAGCVLGAVFTAANVYAGLKSGFSDAGLIAASVLAFAVFAAIRRPLTALENTVIATCSGAAAMAVSTAGLLGPVSAMSMMGSAPSMWAIAVFGMALAVFGVLLALPLRAPLVVEEKLAFPTGAATAEVIRSMSATDRPAGRHARALVGGGALAAIVVWFRDGLPALIPASIDLPGRIGGVLAAHSFSFVASPLLVGTGALIGLSGALSMFGGAVLAWGMLAPLLADVAIIPSVGFQDARGWLLWPGVALIISSALTALALQARTLVRGVRELGAAGAASGRRLLGGIAIAALVVAVLAWILLDVPILLSTVMVLVTPLLAAACARAQGETGLAPVGPIGGLMQLAVGPAAPLQPAVTLGSGLIVYGAANETTQMMTSFKAGHLLGSSPRALIIGQLLGCGVGIAVAVPIYGVLTSAYELGSAALPAPAPMSWKATAEAVTGGAAAMPHLAALAAGIGAALGIFLVLLAKTRAGRWLPSPAAVGVGFILPASYSLAVLVGGASIAVLRRRWPAPVATYGAVVAGGVIGGEALLGVVIAILKVIGAL
jgi:putative OPT family oligopeptide transporter